LYDLSAIAINSNGTDNEAEKTKGKTKESKHNANCTQTAGSSTRK
jgi:hypothetical protein